MAKTRKTRENRKTKSRGRRTMTGHRHRHGKKRCNIGCEIDNISRKIFKNTNLFTTRFIRGSEIKHNYTVRKGLSQHPM